METIIDFPGFEGRQLVLRASGMFSSAKLFLDGQPAPQGPKRNQYTLHRNDGSQVVAQLKTINPISPYPQLTIDGQNVPLGKSLKWYQWLWAGLPLLLVVIGGFLGALFGFIGAFLNGRIFYSERSQPVKFLLTGVISLLAAATFWVSSVQFLQVLPTLFPDKPQEFISQSGEFSVITPKRLQENIQTEDTPDGGQVDIHLFSAETHNAAYMIGYSNYPEQAFVGIDPQLVLANSRDGAVSSVGGTLVSDSETSLQGHPGRELRIEGAVEQGQELVVHSRMFLVRNRLYQVMVIVPSTQALTADMEGFLGSFKLLNP